MGRDLVNWPLEFETTERDRITQDCGALLNAIRPMDSNLDTSALLGSPSQLDFNASTEVAANMQEADLNDLRTLRAKALQKQQWLDTLCASMKTGDATTSDISIRLQTLEQGAVQGIDKLCATMEARDAVISDILNRLKVLEDGAALQESKFQSDLVAVKEQHVQELLELRNDFNKKQAEELLEIRNEQEKQEQQFEKLGSIVIELEQLFSCTKQNLHHEQLNAAWQVKFDELQLWANRQVQSLETEYLSPLGTLVRKMQCSLSEHKQCVDSFMEQMQNDFEKFKEEKDQLREEIAPLKINISGLDQKLRSCVIRVEECKEHQVKSVKNVMQYFQDVHALCAGLDQKMESHMIQAVGCKENQEKSLSQTESNASNIEKSCQAAQALHWYHVGRRRSDSRTPSGGCSTAPSPTSYDPARDPTARSKNDCSPRLQALLQRARSRELP
jgi:hypothetical protein